jgi:serine/threonine protein kinase
MGCIWSARHETLGTLLAVKFINPINTSSSELRGRFAREAVASARISSAHVVQVYDYGVEDDTPYLVMELLEGEDLGVRLRREKRLSLEAACNLVIQVAKGLRRAHEAGIIHRDLKPANIFLARDMDEEVVKILDFGIAKLTWSPEVTGMGQLVGSPLYMSPEQIQQLRSIDQRSDLWSLAVILFRAITGAAPFPGDTTPDVLINILGNSIPVPSQIDPSLPPELDAFFGRAFKREPSERFQSAREMADAFVEAALGEPVSASSWSIVGLYLSQRTSPTPLPPLCEERSPKEKTTQIDMSAPPGRRAGGFKLWQVLGASALVGFGLGWHVLPTPTATRLDQGVSTATMTGSSMLRSLLGARDQAVASATGQAWPRDAGAAQVSPARPLEKADSVLANDYVLANDSVTPAVNAAASKPAGRPTTRRQR